MTCAWQKNWETASFFSMKRAPFSSALCRRWSSARMKSCNNSCNWTNSSRPGSVKFSMTAARKHRRPSITLIGAGNLASVLGPALKSAGYRIDAVVSRPLRKSRRRAAVLAKTIGAKAVALPDAQLQSDIVWLCNTADAILATALRLAERSNWRDKIVFHSSGALSSDVLAPLQLVGAHT